MQPNNLTESLGKPIKMAAKKTLTPVNRFGVKKEFREEASYQGVYLGRNL